MSSAGRVTGDPEPDDSTLVRDARRIAAAAAPLYASMLAASVGAVVTSAVLGQTSTAALAAFALTAAVYAPASAAVAGAVRGVMPFVSSVADDEPALRRALGDGTWLALVVGVLGALAVAAVPLLGGATGVPRTTLDALGIFPWLMAGVVLLNALGAMASASLVGMERSTVVMRAGLAGAVATIVLTPVLVLGLEPMPSLGLAGAGIALLVASLITASVNLAWLHRAVGFSLVGALRWGRSARRVLELAGVGIPMAGTVLVKFGVLGVVALAAARVSTQAAATHGIATAIVGLTFSAAVAVGQAGIPLVSRRAAVGDASGTRRAVVAGSVVAVTVLGVLGGCVIAGDRVVAQVFTADAAVTALLVGLLPVLVLAIAADGLQAVSGFGLTGLKRSGRSFVVFAVVYGALALAALPVGAAFGLLGLWGAVAAANVLLVIGQAGAFWRDTEQLAPPRCEPSKD